MNVSSADSSRKIPPAPLTRARGAGASNAAALLPEVVTHSGLSGTLPAQAHSPEPDATGLPPKGTVAGLLPALVRSGVTRLLHGRLWGRRWSIKTLMAAPWCHWRNEIEIRRTARALAEFDDRTLRKLGIPDRSHIEFTVRFCREC